MGQGQREKERREEKIKIKDNSKYSGCIQKNPNFMGLYIESGSIQKIGEYIQNFLLVFQTYRIHSKSPKRIIKAKLGRFRKENIKETVRTQTLEWSTGPLHTNKLEKKKEYLEDIFPQKQSFSFILSLSLDSIILRKQTIQPNRTDIKLHILLFFLFLSNS